MSTIVRLGDVAEVLTGRVPAKTTNDGDGPRFFGLAEISGHLPRVLESGTDMRHATYLRAGDVVVALLGDLGRSAIVDDPADGAVLGRECAALRVAVTDHLLPSWLYAWTKSRHFELQVGKHVSGTTMPRISISALIDFSLPLPPLSYQEQLKTETDRLDVALKSTSELVRNLEDLRDAEVDLAVARVLVA